MELHILDHNWTYVENPSTSLYELLSYRQKTFNKYSKTWKNNVISLIENGNFLTGLVPYVQETLSHKEQITIKDARQFPEFDYYPPALTVPLRPYQLDYVFNALRNRRVICHCTTASGKTIMLAAIMGILRQPTLVMVPDLTLKGQLTTELKKLLPSFDDYIIDIPRNLTKTGDYILKQYPVLLADECHTVAASQATDVIMRQNAPFRIGFTGTPTGRSDNRDLVVQGLLGPIHKFVEREELVEKGFLAQTDTDIYYASWEGDYPLLEQLLIVQNQRRNELICKIVANHKGKTCLVLVRRVEHGEILRDMIPKSILINGSVDGIEREEIREKVKSGKIKTLIASNVFSTGLDIPNLEVGINAAGGKAEILTGQKLGRVMRPWQDTCKKWVDLYDKWCPTLESHSKERLHIYEQAGIKVNLINFPPALERTLK